MSSEPSHHADDLLARVLEIGVICVVVGAPLMIGAVQPVTLMILEIAIFLLGVVWLVRARAHSTSVPPMLVLAGVAGLLLLALFQVVPLGRGVTSVVSPESVRVRDSLVPDAGVLANEAAILGQDPRRLDGPISASLDPMRTASALRTGSALAILLLVSVTVASTRGVRAVAVALLLSAAFQALYGILMLVSDNPMIWHIPKRHYLDSATGTYVNRNHFAGYLAAALPLGLALAIGYARRSAIEQGRRGRLRPLSSSEGNRALLLGVLLLLGVAGLLVSLSRAGIALGIGALLLTILAAGRRGLRTRLVVALLAVSVAIIPLIQIGSERLAERYSRVTQFLSGTVGRPVVWADTLSMAADFPVVGSGFGTFAFVYPIYRSPELRMFFDHAHNDAVQALAEGGLIGAVLLGMILVPVGRRIALGLSGAGGLMAIGISAGLGALLLHGLIDFNFHIPANAALMTVLAGTLLGWSWTRGT